MIHPPLPPSGSASSPRQAPKKSTRITCHNGYGMGPNVALSVMDLSQTEIRLVLKKSVQPGEEIEVDMESILHRRPFRVLARILWTVPTPDGSYCVGAKFLKKIPYDELQKLAQLEGKA